MNSDLDMGLSKAKLGVVGPTISKCGEEATLEMFWVGDPLNLKIGKSTLQQSPPIIKMDLQIPN